MKLDHALYRNHNAITESSKFDKKFDQIFRHRWLSCECVSGRNCTRYVDTYWLCYSEDDEELEIQAGDSQYSKLSLSVFSRANLCLYFSVVFNIRTCHRCWSGPKYTRHPRNVATYKCPLNHHSKISRKYSTLRLC